MKPYYEDELVTLYHGDAREVIADLGEFDAVITDPVWPNPLEGLPGWEAPTELFADVAKYFPSICRRAVVLLGCDSDPRFLSGIPASMPYFRTCWMEYVRPSYKGRVLYTGDVAYVFGVPITSAILQRVIPGRFIEPNSKHRGPRFDGHPCPRHVAEMRWLVRWFSEGRVLDPFAGGCTTAIACREWGRECVCVELDEGFCEAAAKRLATGQRTFDEAAGEGT